MACLRLTAGEQIITINDMATKQLGVKRWGQIWVFWICSISDEYDLRDLITNVPELTIDSQDENGEYLSLRVRFALVRRESGFISGLVAVLHDTTEQDKEERERRLFVSNVSHELRTPLTSVKSIWKPWMRELCHRPVAPDFVKGIAQWNQPHDADGDGTYGVCPVIDNETSHLEVELTNFTAFITFILNRFDKIKNQDETKYEIIRGYPITPIWWDWYR